MEKNRTFPYRPNHFHYRHISIGAKGFHCLRIRFFILSILFADSLDFRFHRIMGLGQKKKTMNLKFGWALCGAAIFFIMAFILSIKMKNPHIISLITGLVYFFLYIALLSKINQDNEIRQA